MSLRIATGAGMFSVNLRQIGFGFVLVLVLVFLEQHLGHMEVPRLGVESELQLPAYAIATAMPDLSSIYKLHSPRQHRILNPLSGVNDRIRILMDTSWVHNH